MFGRRADGRVLREIDPIIALTPYLMPMRCDAQVMSNYKLDYEKMARYIVEQGQQGQGVQGPGLHGPGEFFQAVALQPVQKEQVIPSLLKQDLLSDAPDDQMKIPRFALGSRLSWHVHLLFHLYSGMRITYNPCCVNKKMTARTVPGVI